MESFLERISFLRPNLWDLLEMAVVAYIFYRLLLLWAGTRAIQMLMGLIVLSAVYALSGVLQLDLIHYLLRIVFTYGALAAVILFQPELRSALTKLGQNRFWRFFSRSEKTSEALQELAHATEVLARKRIGAIIAVEKEVGLEEYARKGTPINAPVSTELLESIFARYGPLHDGAVILRGEMMMAARCILPLTQFPVTDRTLGTRHRAAIGLSEETDALVIVVSEETGHISLARRGRLERKVSGERLREALGLTSGGRGQVASAVQMAPSAKGTEVATGELSLVDRQSPAP